MKLFQTAEPKLVSRGALGVSLLSALLLCGPAPVRAQGPYAFQNAKASPEDRITDLLSRMTLEEKIDALGTNPTIPRL